MSADDPRDMVVDAEESIQVKYKVSDGNHLLLDIPPVKTKICEEHTSATWDGQVDYNTQEHSTFWDTCKDYGIRLYHSSLLCFLFITSAYGLLSFSIHIYSLRVPRNDLGVAWIENSQQGQNVLAFTAEFSLANDSDRILRLFKSNTKGMGLGFIKNTSGTPTMRIVLKLYPNADDSKDRPAHQNDTAIKDDNRTKRSIRDNDLPLSLDWEQFAAYEDDYPVRLDVHLENYTTSDSDNTTDLVEEQELETVKNENIDIPSTFDPYAEKCRQYWNDFQQTQIFAAANRELQKIQKGLEAVLSGAENAELDMKDDPPIDQTKRDQIVVRQAIYELLKRFGGKTESAFHKIRQRNNH
ncbi:uncharacterized protein LOC129585199 [Paramacrobiotus metropolitanus]|uniref:uncharacterized protein LOC129585199 n=1 Tax=Paramacrobiotus metropolitanus TaxID=2943436 RepID=UPI0024456131|nr:uncharacterized protein LOC129585199 [Paramacrobiotus metropolitanus]XP_055333777.1 uncharacterized protein LOC129585199 [Paramacrobiotus metropolitanus]XP_055333784.1 uncharacterized protein LOC129585199 [Paramacrobiotus metropolitanus]XP_055333793.1 uncharacterized protein LOC129585199 [Paramacrobiotus metropolitanus]